MSQNKLLSVKTKALHARRLQQLLLDYHDYRMERSDHPLAKLIDQIGKWQIQRLKLTHAELYRENRYHAALNFLLEDLYSPDNFVGRDTDLERVFPKMVKIVPDQALDAVANLVELNLLTQKLDEHLATVFDRKYPGVCLITDSLGKERYVQSFRECNNLPARQRQLQLISITGTQLERYVNSRLLSFSLSLTQKPAEMAGLGQLHHFIRRGFKAFLAMGGVNELLDQVISKETEILERIFADDPSPF